MSLASSARDRIAVVPQTDSGSLADEDGQDRKPIFSLLQGQSEILDLISGGAPLKETLDRTAAVAELVVQNTCCSIQLLGPEGERFVDVVVASLPEDYVRHISLNRIGDMASVEAICAATKKPVYIPDLSASAPETPAYLREFAGSQGLKAVSAHPMLDQSGEPVGVLSLYFQTAPAGDAGVDRIVRALASLARFAIEHHRSNEALRSADQRFGALAASIPGVVYQRMVTPDGQIRYTYISDGAKDLFGVSPEEIISDPNALFDCHSPQYRETFRERLLEASRDLKMWDVEATIVTKDGEQKFTHAIARPHRTSDGTVYWDGVILDATRIKEAELEAASIEARTREAILESISQGLALYDENEELVVCNSHFLEFNPELDDVIRPGVSYETVARALIDSSDDAEASTAQRDEQLQRQMELHRSGGHVAERRLPNGRWILITEHRTGHGGTAIVHTDVTELKEREAKLERSNHELQQFASVASHDLQEPLRKIEAFGDRLNNLCGGSLGEEATLYLDRMLSSTKRMRKLINDLLAYSRVTTKSRPFESCNFKVIAEEVVSDLQIQIEESDGRVEIGDLPVIEADAMQMRQLLQNLISNALKFRRKDVPPVVTVSGQIAASGGNHPAGSAPPAGELLELCISDNGIGFDMKYVGRIFNIFQRLHNRSEYEGTGIGLATCRKIVERHGGALRAVSNPGNGTTITAILPVKQTLTEA
ncbi:MAG: PAS-domain containing protein [Alphaproteobacteria bacterium]|nr:PAS-domain containing protein [Alphaproteobacteria bacterium]